MRLNKIIVGASAFAMAAAISAGVGSADASAAKVEGSVSDKISIDYASQTLKVTEPSDTKISVAFPTVNKDKKVGADKNLCTYDVPTTGSKVVVVDLSTLNVTKDNYIKVWGNKNKVPVIVKIPAATQLGKGTVKTDDNTLTVAKKKETTGVTVALDYAIGNGDFKKQAAGSSKATEIDVANYTQLGATLRVRVSASATAENAAIIAKDAVEYVVGKSTTDKVKVYELDGTFAGKEVKVKVAKMANAPKVKVDYTKGTVTLPKGAEYRVNTIGASAALGNKFNAGDKLVLTAVGTSAADVAKGTVLDFTNGGDIDVRIAKTDKKPASKYLSFVYNKKAVIAPTTTVSSKDNPSGITSNNVASVTFKVTEPSASAGADYNKLKVAYARTAATYDSKGKTKTATSGAVTIDNSAEETYAYQYVVTNSNTTPAVDVKGIKTVKAKAKVVVKLKNKEDQYVYIRRAAVIKGDVAWATDWVQLVKLSKTDMIPTAPAGK